MRSAWVLVLLLALAGCDGDRTSAPVPAATSPSAPTSVTAELAPSSPLQHGLLARLAADPAVRTELLGRVEPRGMVLCGIDVLGRAGGERYAWLMCGAYRTGPQAELLSGGAGPVVIRRGGGVEFPAHGLAAEIDRLFPPDVANAMRYRDFALKPTDAELLALATAAAPAEAPSR